jgi:formylglycine-generating enzyme required for sulfatase activity
MKVALGRAAGPASDGNARLVARFLEEAQVTAQLDHPGIVPVHELGLAEDGRVYFTMKLVKGRDLEKVFALAFAGVEGWNETRALGVLLKVCEAMAYAHKKKVIHRDLKPSNVMVGHFGEVYVMDWGLARVLGRGDAHDLRWKPGPTTAFASVATDLRAEREGVPDSPLVTMDGDVLGTPSYMAPEQARGEIEELSPRSDVYSIGAMLYHLLTRQVPYVAPRMRVSNRTVLALVLQGPPAPLHALRKDVPAELAAICEKAMAREPAARYADTLELAEDLRAFLEHRVVRAYETGAVAELRKWVARNRPLAAASTAALLIALGGLAWVSVVQSRARADIETKNRALSAARTSAEDNERIARAKADDVLSLSAMQDLQDLTARAETLWPPEPALLPAYEAWIADARALVEGRAADPARGTKAKPGLAAHERRLAELPLAEVLEQRRGRCAWGERMLAKLAAPAALPPEPETPEEPADADRLNDRAWPLVDPDRRRFGEEELGLALAARALPLARPERRAPVRDTLAWALFANGRLDEALDAARAAVEEAVPARKDEFRGYLARLEGETARWRDLERVRAELAAERAELEHLDRVRAGRALDPGEDRWWHTQLEQLVRDLRALADPATGLLSDGISPRFGWGIARRAEFARTIEERSVTGAEAALRWREAAEAVRDTARAPLYQGLVLVPELGLLPIGADPESGLWEFAHLASGEPARRGADGRIVLEETTGIVLVLVPGGTFWMGAQPHDPTEPNHDPAAQVLDAPVHRVTLAPYFLAKYELTQGQWLRMTGANPSQFSPRTYTPEWNREGKAGTLLLPVESMSWTEATTVLARFGLALPTEAQWERAARAGTETPWWTGVVPSSLAGAANVSDRYASEFGGWRAFDEDLDDGQTCSAPVGTYRANPFGFHDVHGNLAEWCRDLYGDYELPWAAGDGERRVPAESGRALRDAGFRQLPIDARSARRMYMQPDGRNEELGLRPARALRAR